MKRILSFLCILSVITISLSAFADAHSDMLLNFGRQTARNAGVVSAFENNSLTLIKTEFPPVTGENFEGTKEMWQVISEDVPEDPETVIASAVAKGTKFTWLSLSPSGNSGFLTADERIGMCCYNGKYHFLYPSNTRGVADTNGNLARFQSLRLQQLIGKAGIEYSPDGRYAAIFNIQYPLYNNSLFLDPIIIDLSSGEMILTETYGNDLREIHSGAVTASRFSSDGKYFYYILYGHPENSNEKSRTSTALYRYDLQSQQTEFCYSGSDKNYFPCLVETENGAFCILQDATTDADPQGLTVITYDNSQWTGKTLLFDLPQRCWTCDQLISSPKSGYSIVSGRLLLLSDSYFAFQRVRLNDGVSGLNQYLYISKEDNQVHSITSSEIKDRFINCAPGSQEAASALRNGPFQIILTSVLSPDGNYVLLNTVNYNNQENHNETHHLFLVRLDDLSVKEVQGIDPSQIEYGPFAKKYQPMIEWNTDTLIINTTSGIQAYRFE